MKEFSINRFLFSTVFSTIIFFSCTKGTKFKKLDISETRIDFINAVSEGIEVNFLNYIYFYNGGGVAIGDINNDGLDDLFFTSNQLENRLYLNEGNFSFTDITQTADITTLDGSWSTGVAMADVNGDGWLDIYVSNVNYLSAKGKNQLYINDKDGTFTEKAQKYGLDFEGYSVQAAFLDYDKDDDLDMFLLNHSVHSVNTYQPVDSRVSIDPKSGDKLFRNDENIFTDVSQEAGIFGSALGFGLGVTVSDINSDGWPDVYVGNDFHEDDYLYINNGDGTFANRLDEFIRHTAQFSMSVDIADINNDGLKDIATTDMLPREEKILKQSGGGDTYKVSQIKRNYGYSPQYARNMLQLNVGEASNPRFSEIGYLAGISATDWSWSGLLVDLDNDSYRDFYIANGIFRRPNDLDYINYISNQQIQASLEEGLDPENLELIKKMPQLKIPNYVFQNEGDLTFANRSKDWGLDDESYSNGAAYGDLDNDGDLDLVVNNVNQPAFIYRNNSANEESPHSFLQIKLKGNRGNTSGIGAKVFAYSGKEIYILEQSPVRGFQSSISHILHFGLGEVNVLDSLVIIWQDDSFQTLKNVAVNTRVELYQNEAKGVYSYESTSSSTSIFEDITTQVEITAKHSENGFVDFDNETLIPHYESNLGPPIAVADVNGDGLEDFFMGNAKWSVSQLWLQKKDGSFEQTEQKAFQDDIEFEDTDAEFVNINGDKFPDLFVASGGGEHEGQFEDLPDRLYLNNGDGTFRKYMSYTKIYSNTGSLAINDFDNDGDTDIFSGGRSVPGLYGFDPLSFLLINNGRGQFYDVTDILAPDLRRLGMITDAEWFDYDTDGDKDLIIVGEWMQITLFENIYNEVRDSEEPQPGFKKVNEEVGFVDTEGWWISVTTSDLDGDGDEDILAGNLGRNSYLKASEQYPVELFLNDYNNDRLGDPIITHYKEGKRYPVATLDELKDQMNNLKKKFPNYAEYNGRTFSELINERQLDSAITKKAVRFASSVFYNNGDGTFSGAELPWQAQISPVYDFIVDDFNADGNMDIFLGGNFSGVRPLFGNYDANYGTLLLADGTDSWINTSIKDMGVELVGEVRDMEQIILADGSKGILIARNSDNIMLIRYKN